ncbi:methyl-accepting chemotaxis protein [Trichocoleus sp. DQ-U1]|uniref:HAMP domain-containing methyl-accepting chemotaxis protein n=1 Tax=Trichocoleus sp. DQ-U1 TaxID=2933926 RepID=UPI0032982AF5
MNKPLKLKSRILLGYSVPILLAMGVAGVVHYNIHKVAKVAEEVKSIQNNIIQIDEMILGISVMVRNTRGHVVFPKEKSYEKTYEEGIKLFREASRFLEGEIQDPQQRENLTKIIEAGQKIDEASRKIFNLLDSGKIAEAVELTKSIRMLGINDWREDMLKQANYQLAAQAKQQDTAMYWLTIVVWLGAGLSAIFALGIGSLIASRISQQINEIVDAIAHSSRAIASTVEQQERIAVSQASSVNQTTTTMDELGTSSLQSAQQAAAASAGARQALILAEGGTEAVQQTLGGMAMLSEKVAAIAAQILQLNEQTHQISNITNLVSDLANQTNMLALNAAVEAVRAGEHGKGFAVVAGEIRKLADQSKKSAQEINTLVVDIQRAINSTVKVTDEGTKTVEEGVQFSYQTADAFKGMTNAINHVVTNSQQIALSAQQQAIAIQQVVDAMNVLNQGAKETASGIGQTKAGTQNLNEAALNLKSIV